MEVFPKNTLCCYTAKLPQAIQFDDEAYWEVALVEMIHPTQIKNIVESQNTVSVEVEDDQVQQVMDERSDKVDFPKIKNPVTNRTTYMMKIPSGYYFSGQHLVNILADRFNAMFEKALEKTKKSVKIEYHKIARRLLMKFSHDKVLAITFCPELYHILGGNPEMVKNHPTKMPPIGNNLDFAKHFHFPVVMNQGLNLIFVYSDVVEYNVVGHTSVPLLRVIPFKVDSATAADEEGGNTYHVHREFVHPHYLPVSKSYFDTVNITIKGDLGQNIPFTQGKVTVKLHFRKRVL
jgi:hypothetical protein